MSADVLVATAGTGVNAWLDAASTWDLDETLKVTLNRADILARGPKSVGALWLVVADLGCELGPVGGSGHADAETDR
ncbi:MAG: hypothetical protein ACXWW7_12195 [Nocardioides sp.]